MKTEIRHLLRGNGLREAFCLEPADALRLEDFASYHFPEPLTFEGELISENGGILRLKGVLSFVWEASCDRCLAPVRREEKILLDEQIFPEDYRADISHHVRQSGDGAGEEEDEVFDPEELPTHDGRFFEPDKLFQDLALLNLPIGVYCSEDCPGLCPICGRRRDDPACHCEIPEEKAAGPFDKLLELL